jgi:hypothetical protein
MYSFPLIFLWFISERKYEIIHADTRYCTFYIWAVVLLLSENRTINYLDLKLHGLMLQIIYTTVVLVKESHYSWSIV